MRRRRSAPSLARAVYSAGGPAAPEATFRCPTRAIVWLEREQFQDQEARAVENTVFVAAAGQAPPTGVGNSVILDPMGVPIASLGEGTGLAVGTLERDRLEHVRAVNPALSLRRYAVVPAT